MSAVLTGELDSLPEELRRRHRKEFEALYDEYASFPTKFKLLKYVSVRLDPDYITTVIMAINAEDLQNSNLGSSREYIIEKDHPVERVRFGHLLSRGE